MAYCDSAGLVARFGDAELLRIADRDNDDKIDGDVVQGALDDASDEIDAYVGTRYALPMSPAPAFWIRLRADMAGYRLYDESPLDEVAARYKQAIPTLRDISNGRATLKDASQTPTSGDVEVIRDDCDRVFTRESLR